MPRKPTAGGLLAKEIEARQLAEAEIAEQEERDKRNAEALRLRRQGKSYWQIAEELGITHHEVSQITVTHLKEAADMVSQAKKTEQLQLEIERLDEMQAAIYPAALAGDVNAARTVLSYIDKRAKLMGLETLDSATLLHTLVTRNDPEGYRLALEQAAANAMYTTSVERIDEPSDEYSYTEDLPSV
jgi:hypothetical protein